MHCSSRFLAIVVGVSCIFATTVPCRADHANVDQILAAVGKGRDFLLKSQAADGSWDPAGTQTDTSGNPTHTWGGYTALATYALLASGSSAQDPPIVKAKAWLEACQMKSVYCLGCRMQVWLLLYQQADPTDKTTRSHLEQLAGKDVKTLLDDLDTKGDHAGIWDYFGKSGRIDHSVSQYGVLGLWAAAQMGGEIPLPTWVLLDKTWREQQYTDGGWSYDASGQNPGLSVVKASMTAAGIATLFITQQYAHPGFGLACAGDIPNDNIENGLTWMTKNFGTVTELYTYYGVERIGVASGYKYFGTTDWFAEISTRLVQTQAADGSWEGWGPIPGTSFGLLFLSRGGAPVMMNKLDYSIASNGHKVHANWNERPRDAFNLAHWAGVQAEADLNWQVVNLSVSVDDLHDSPILFMTGNQELKLSDADEKKLRQFVEEGGMIVGNADCNSELFGNSFKTLGSKLFPKYEFKELGKDNLIYTGETYKAAKMRGHQTIFGLSNGVRQLILLFPTGDPARFWQQNSTQTQPGSFMIGANIFQYATDLTGLRKKGDTYIVHPDPNAAGKSVKVARLMIGGNPNPEPGGWRRLAAILHNAPYDLGVTVTDVTSEDLQKTDALADYKIAVLTGTTAFKLTADESTALQDFVNKGGTLIIDSAGGSGVFGDAAESMLQKLFPKEAPKGLARALPLSNTLYNLPNAEITTIKYRRYAQRNLMGSAKSPHIRGIEVNKRLAIFFSPEDITSGLVGEQVDGIVGYDPATATALMRNLVLFATK